MQLNNEPWKSNNKNKPVITESWRKAALQKGWIFAGYNISWHQTAAVTQLCHYWGLINCIYNTRDSQCFLVSQITPKTVPSHGGISTPSSTRFLESACKMASWSVCLFLHSTFVWATDRHTDHATWGRILCTQCMRCGLKIKFGGWYFGDHLTILIISLSK